MNGSKMLARAVALSLLAGAFPAAASATMMTFSLTGLVSGSFKSLDPRVKSIAFKGRTFSLSGSYDTAYLSRTDIKDTGKHSTKLGTLTSYAETPSVLRLSGFDDLNIFAIDSGLSVKDMIKGNDTLTISATILPGDRVSSFDLGFSYNDTGKDFETSVIDQPGEQALAVGRDVITGLALKIGGYSYIGNVSFLNEASFKTSVSRTGSDPVPAGVPEPSPWLMMIAGFGAIGGTMRRRQMADTRFVRN